MGQTLICWLGKTDLRAVTESERVGFGPVAQALQTERFSRLELICDYAKDTAAPYLDWLDKQFPTLVTPHFVSLTSPMDFGEIYRHARGVVARVTEEHACSGGLTFHLSPGTPAMAAVWIILAKTRFPAELIESSIAYGVRTTSVPFEISADFIPDLLHRPDQELKRLTAGLPSEAPEFSAIVHRSSAMQRAIALSRRASLRSIPVLIEGESGTGKELFARAIHQSGPRSGRPFVTVNCGAISPDLVESEIFGHERGAFTGATTVRKGYFEAAHQGTLFLDEVGELPKPAQVKFLRVLQDGEITRVGATSTIPLDVRIIAATNRSLTDEVAQGRFREDLFYRLAVAVIRLPPIRDREGDAGLLLDTLMDQVNRESENEPGYSKKKLSVGARNVLLTHHWPGNVREMLNTLRRAAVWSAETTIDAVDASDALLPARTPTAQSDQVLGHDITQGIDLRGMIDGVARHYLKNAMQASGGNKTRAAELLGLASYQTLTNWLRKYEVEE